MPDFTPDDMESFGREAMKPYLKLGTFMKRETWNYGSKTEVFVRTFESADLNWAVGLMCIQFRSGVVAFVSELWQCYEGEGVKGLDERWDIGTAWFAHGVDENQIADVLAYVAESERLVNRPQGADFSAWMNAFYDSFNRHIKSKEVPVIEPEVEAAAQGRFESAAAVVQAVIDASS